MADDSLKYGGCYISTPASTTLSATTPAKAAGTTSSMGLNGFSHTDNRLTYTGTATRVFHITVSISAQHSGSGSTTFSLWLYKNAAAITGTEITRYISGTGDTGAGSTQALVSLATNDYVEMWVETDDGDDVELEFGTMIARVAG